MSVFGSNPIYLTRLLKKKKKDSGYEKDLNKNFKKMKILIITDIKNK